MNEANIEVMSEISILDQIDQVCPGAGDLVTVICKNSRRGFGPYSRELECFQRYDVQFEYLEKNRWITMSKDQFRLTLSFFQTFKKQMDFWWANS